ncbi:triphosphoribosyl-dephospho-CoA synthase CitG [Clostridium magnum]|uniref:Probable 2-(5''-triphosphoribosyl)-3'-dephosphocoenzyme-A synthase n=1 Tax=Clostridium magnum DSM 2767 TaxID=1121326 RepID=A0A162S8W4_9CLOT|nr:triphosphoribosyl-dephospho-CoA synthase CitG [Clostridium magnum]KZL90923.1 2-(5''-triphosphoribosyl)-3'-dephosphocoenzyme-A synthase [Clostridium magnum DSM 2767]SHJ37934.1 triphosphoribosyl-dephospho-CoA synthase [Clostridium magnum DSM 2767]
MIQDNEFAHYVASMAQKAILYEVSATPKPGLVDRYNSGSHRDMDFFTFMASSSALYSGLYECVLEGIYFDDSDSTNLMDRLRIPGIKCEKSMFKATNGINTHKGIVFSLGVLCGAVGNLYRKHGKEKFFIEEVCNEVKSITKDLTVKDFNGIDNKSNLTHGERLFKEYGYKGIRGEVESGFETVQKQAVPIIREWSKKRQLSINDLLLQVLMSIMTESEDTNVVIRGGIESLIYAKSISKDFLKFGGMYQADARKKLEIMNTRFVERNISPGGSADLLAVSIFLGLIEGIVN